MPKVRRTIPNLLGGVSQQPDAIRSSNQGELQQNSYPSPVDGLVKRPPSEHLEAIQGVPSAAAQHAFHTINRDVSEQYLIYIDLDSPSLVVTNLLTGGNHQVHRPGGGAPDLSYIAGMSDARKLDVLTVNDYTFFTNGEKVVAMDAAVSSDNPDEAYVFVRQGAYSAEYRLRVTNTGGVLRSVVYSTGDGTGGGGDEPDNVRTTWISQQLVSLLEAAGAEFSPNTVATASLVVIRPNTGRLDFLSAQDSLGNSAMSSWIDSIDFFSNLPAIFRSGYVVRVDKDPDRAEDDYYVSFKLNSGITEQFGPGFWFETLGTGEQLRLDESTMPHKLVRRQDDGIGSITGTPNAIYFEWDVVPWQDRLVGDSAVTSNPDPNFVGKKIGGAFFWQNRLGFFADENVALSEVGNYFNFFRTTVRTVVDSDPILVSASHTKPAILRSAFPVRDQAILGSDRSQFSLRGGDFLSPGSVSIQPKTEFSAYRFAPMEDSKRGMLMSYGFGGFTGIRDIFPNPQKPDDFESDELTAQVPHYIVGEPKGISNSSEAQAVVIHTHETKDRLWLYKYFWNGPERLQTAWCEYTFTGGDLIHAGFIRGRLYLVFERTDGLWIESILFGDGRSDTDVSWVASMDRRFDESQLPISPSYDSILDQTTFRLLYDIQAGETYQVITREADDTSAGAILTVVATDSGTPGQHTITVPGDHRETELYIGTQVKQRYQFTRLTAVEPRRSGGTAPLSGPWQLNRALIRYANAAFFKIRVAQAGTDDDVYEFSSANLGAPPIVGSIAIADGTFEMGVMGEAQETSITLENDTPLPGGILSAEFEGTYRQRARSMG